MVDIPDRTRGGLLQSSKRWSRLGAYQSEPPPDKPEQLTGVLKAWPDGIEGSDAAERDLEWTLGDIRRIDKLREIPVASLGPGGAAQTERHIDAAVSKRA